MYQEAEVDALLSRVMPKRHTTANNELILPLGLLVVGLMGLLSSVYQEGLAQSGRLMHILMTKLNHVGKVHHLKAKRQIAESVGQIAKFKRRYEQNTEESNEK
ncbi:uncharacterized protein LOC110022517 isoform X5 [Phalaenopsis equestris]|uniref:uncharacterized protein LOC110022517 isoform X5 n=1 Tax=Phalaenopsis equestris TaxID=78828 RepID=UPI0009E4F0F2|nr:uncharacterized protein LOC110022517 isoform X5 [Phalaenopsis equestris]